MIMHHRPRTSYCDGWLLFGISRRHAAAASSACELCRRSIGVATCAGAACNLVPVHPLCKNSYFFYTAHGGICIDTLVYGSRLDERTR